MQVRGGKSGHDTLYGHFGGNDDDVFHTYNGAAESVSGRDDTDLTTMDCATTSETLSSVESFMQGLDRLRGANRTAAEALA